MKNSLLSITLLILFASFSADARPIIQPANPSPDDTVKKVDPGQPLFLTPYIMSGQIEQARQLAKVYEFVPCVESYTGYITVDNKTGSNFFFWMVATQRNQGKAPLMVWLQGGPGAASLYALFTENGPFVIDAAMNVSKREYAWTNMYNMIWIDNPVGTGYSFVTDEAGYRVDEDGIANHLYDFIVQFYALFPQLQDQPFYISGESYAGKYVPAFGKKVAEMEKLYASQGKKSPVGKLGALLIGNGATDPEAKLKTMGDHLHSVGLLSANQLDFFNGQANQIIDLIHQKKFKDAFLIYDMLINGDIYPYPTFFRNATGCRKYFNFLLCNHSPPDMDYYSQWLQLDEIRAKIHVGNLDYNDSSITVEMHLVNDWMETVKPRVEYLLTETDVRILYYSGNLDLIVPTVSTDYLLKNLMWPHRDEWLRADRDVWRNDQGDAVAYSQTVGPLSFVVIRNAGHMVPYDQPETAFRMITSFLGDA